uniref:Aqueous glue droplet peptide n=1 Tax=Latrodectus hesperus TaxID=256737 RepID=A3R4V5_LATHE|nr:aqueous glue droplet peptide [Latrodectus hesperus]
MSPKEFISICIAIAILAIAHADPEPDPTLFNQAADILDHVV